MTETEAKNLNTAALAFMGDAVYEQAVREHILEKGLSRVDSLHRTSTRYVRAQAQAEIIQAVFEQLDPQEQALVLRGRNHRYHSKAKNADPMTYKWATAFEALTGYLYLTDDRQRLAWLFAQAFSIVEGAQADR